MKSRNFKILLVVLSVFLIAFTGCKKPGEKKPEGVTKEEIRIPVETSSVAEGSIDRYLSFTGTIRSKRKVELFSRIAARVQTVKVEEGDRVRRGELLIEMEDDEWRAQVGQAQAALQAAQARLRQAKSSYNLTTSTTGIQVDTAQKGIEQSREMINQAKANYDNARLEYDRMKNLYKKGAVSKQTLDQVTTQYRVAKSQYNASKVQTQQARENWHLARAQVKQNQVRYDDIVSANAGIAQAQANIDYLMVLLKETRIFSPITGVVTLRDIEPGEKVAPGDKNPILVITDNTTVYLEAEIPENSIRGVKVGDEVEVKTDALGSEVFKGKVQTIIPSADSSSRAFRIKVSIDNLDGRLIDGMSAKGVVRIETLNGLVIPRHWLKVIEGDFYVVMADKENRAYHKKVILDYYDENQAFVKEGLEKGEKVISKGQETLKDGDLLDIKGEEK